MRPSPSLKCLIPPSAQMYNNKMSPLSFTCLISSPLITTAVIAHALYINVLSQPTLLKVSSCINYSLLHRILYL